jgi:anti-sigma B factor antagonist
MDLRKRSQIMPPASGSRLRVKQHQDVVQIEFIDRNILDEANIAQIGEEITGIVEAAATPKLLISFASVDHLSSAALGALITINNRVKHRKGQLRLANIDPQIYEVFKITKLDKLFQIHENTESAMSSFI